MLASASKIRPESWRAMLQPNLVIHARLARRGSSSLAGVTNKTSPGLGCVSWREGSRPLSATSLTMSCRGLRQGRPIAGEMEGVQVLARCKQYLEESNLHNVEACLAMFAEDACYGSTTVGGHKGIDAISNMMRGFFEKCPKVHWQVPAEGESGSYSLEGPTVVAFDFVRTGVPNAEGRDTKQVGRERVHFGPCASGGPPRITLVEVEVLSTEAL